MRCTAAVFAPWPLVMEADGVDPIELEAMLKRVAYLKAENQRCKRLL